MRRGSPAYCALKNYLTCENSYQRSHHDSQKKYYFKHSHTRYIFNHLEAEIIFRPYNRLILYDDYLRLKDDLWITLMQACAKGEDYEEEYCKHIDIEKIAINVDYLIIVRKIIVPVGFTAGTYITKDLFYISCSIVNPQSQHIGIGAVITALLCYQVIQNSRRLSKKTPYFICRTQNQKAASSILKSMVNGIISTEQSLDFETKKKILLTAQFLNCPIDLDRGISPHVYPCGLPKGKSIKDRRINKAFEKLKPTDACYVLGKLDEKFINYLITKHTVSSKKTLDSNKTPLDNIKSAA